MYQINNKFEIGEQCWTFCNKNTYMACIICDEDGNIQLGGKTFRCPSCNGKKELLAGTIQIPCKVKVKRIDFVVRECEKPKIKYKVMKISSDGNPVTNRIEHQLFKTEEETVEYCKKENNKN